MGLGGLEIILVLVVSLICAAPFLIIVALLVGKNKKSGANLKACRFCAEMIQAQAVICRYCGKDVLGLNPSQNHLR